MSSLIYIDISFFNFFEYRIIGNIFYTFFYKESNKKFFEKFIFFLLTTFPFNICIDIFKLYHNRLLIKINTYYLSISYHWFKNRYCIDPNPFVGLG